MKLDKLPYGLLSAYVAKLLYFGANVSDAIIVASLVGLVSFFYFVNSKKEQPINDEVKKDIEELKNRVSNISIAKTFVR